MEINILNHTPEPERTVAAAARLCYTEALPNELFHGLSEEKCIKLVQKLMDMGHESPMEHVTFTFGIKGVSRTLSHQLVRHRIASYSQKSQRYVSESGFQYVVPPSIERDEEAYQAYQKLMEQIQQSYYYLSEKVPNEDARYVLPNACETNLVATFNARSLNNFFELRCCSRAQWEIRELANSMLTQVKKVAPNLFNSSGAKCDIDGTCPEGEKSCGKYKQIILDFK